jgi:hypothetical protein
MAVKKTLNYTLDKLESFSKIVTPVEFETDAFCAFQ